MNDLEASIAELVRRNAEWGDVIRTCVEWSREQREEGHTGQFTRETIYYRIGKTKGEGPKLTPLVRAGVIEKAWTNSRRKPYYQLASDPQEILGALSRAWATEGIKRMR